MDKETIILKETIPFEKFKYMFNIKDDRTADIFVKNANIKITIDDKKRFVDFSEIKKRIKLEKLPERFLTLEEVAEIIGTTKSIVTKLKDNGLIPFYQYGENSGSRCLFVKEEILDAKEYLKQIDIEIVASCSFGTNVFKLQMYERMLEHLLCFFESSKLFLTEREIIILRSANKDGESIGELAKRLNLTTERVRQIYEKTMRKMHSLARNQKIIFDECTKLKEEKAYLKFQLEEEKARTDRMKDELVSLGKGDKDFSTEGVTLEFSKLLCTEIGDLDMSVRAHTFLKKSNIRTLGELVSFGKDKTLKSPNIGNKTFNELTKLITSKGLVWH